MATVRQLSFDPGRGGKILAVFTWSDGSEWRLQIGQPAAFSLWLCLVRTNPAKPEGG